MITKADHLPGKKSFTFIDQTDPAGINLYKANVGNEKDFYILSVDDNPFIDA